MVVFLGPPWAVLIALAGTGFHLGNLLLFDIDFLRFWLISYACSSIPQLWY